jgi:SAM-dependent methyltransferase
MSKSVLHQTDHDWEELALSDPYWAVLTNDEFRNQNMGDAERARFFSSGQHEIDRIFEAVRRVFGEHPRPTRALDFGCGVGRLSLPLARYCDHVVAIDIAEGMLLEARRNAIHTTLDNIDFVCSDDRISKVEGNFDFIISCIVFQHIPPDRGWIIFKRLLELLRPGGVGVIHLLYSKEHFEDCGSSVWLNKNDVGAHSVGQTWQLFRKSVREWWRRSRTIADVPPKIQMFPYNLNPFVCACQRVGIQQVHLELSNHGGEYGVFMYIRKPEP